MLDKEKRGQIATAIVAYEGEKEMLKDIALDLISRKADTVGKLMGISRDEHLEYAMEILELITGYEINIPGTPRESRKPLSEEKKGEISLLIVKRSLFVKMSFQDINRRIGNIAAATGIAKEDMEAFAQEVMQEVAAEGISRIGKSKRRQRQKNRGK